MMLDAATTCDRWDVEALLSHMLETLRYFAEAARGENVSSPSTTPRELVGDDLVGDCARVRAEMMRASGTAGVIEKIGPSLGIAFADQLLHGWDLAKSTDQDATMPESLPDVAYEMIHGRFSEDQRKGVFKAEVAAPADASDPSTVVASHH